MLHIHVCLISVCQQFSIFLVCVCFCRKIHFAEAAEHPFYFIEFFCGRAVIAGAFGESGFPCRAFDVLRSSSHDLTLPIGVVLGMISVLGLPVGCPLRPGTVCTSFCWVNSGTHRRTLAFPYGCTDYEYVINGNMFATVSVS